MTETPSGDPIDDLVGQAVEEYFQRLKRGQRPQLDEFLRRYPGISDILKTVIPGLQAAETSGGESADGSVAYEENRQLGDFRIIRQIGRGGMGIVYEAEQISMKRPVALKVLPLAGLVDERKIRRFQNEVRAVAALDNPNIVSVYMVGEERGVHYYAMQLIRGRSLSDVISSLQHVREGGSRIDGSSISQVTSKGRVDERAESDLNTPRGHAEDTSRRRTHVDPNVTVAKADSSTIPHSSRREYFRCVATLGIQAATALQHAHEEGIIHRDIKPANLLLDYSAKLHLADFGLARIESGVGVTMTGDLIGTLRYMAPEQAIGKRVAVDHRADIYSLAVTLYELLVLRPAYLADDRQQLLKQIAFEEPTQLRRIDADIPVELETIIHKGMSKDMHQRYSSAQELADDLSLYLENRPIKAKPPTFSEIIGKWTRRNPILTWATVVTLSLVSVTVAASTYFISKQRARATSAQLDSETAQGALRRERQARTQAIPELRALVDEEMFSEALARAIEVERLIPDDPELAKMWPEFSAESSITTDPPGVDVSIRQWNVSGDIWKSIGTTPINHVRLPKGQFHWKLAKKDHATLVLLRTETKSEMTFTLESSDGLPPGMVKVTGDKTFVALNAIQHVKMLNVGDFLIDRCEVTNREFQDFVDQGGYASRKYWEHPFVSEDGTLPWDEAMAQFVDSTGMPGPAGWRSGRFPEGKHDYPVRGISWYEAAAYAVFAGKQLPSVYQWARAADLWQATYIIPVSNFGMLGPAPVGRYRGVGGNGTLDMAGNVKEWCWNGTGSGTRYILGGAWNEPMYMFNTPDVQSPLARSETFGFRCVKILPGGDTSPNTYDDISRVQRNFYDEEPISDEEFAFCRRNFLYVKSDFSKEVLLTRELDGCSYEKIVFEAAYGDEPVTAHFYRPSRARPPYQTVIYFPPAHALIRRHFDETVVPSQIAFLVENGRAVLYPIYKGTFERGSDLSSAVPAATPPYREHLIAWSKDLSRSIDYLETRADVEHNELAYYGYSWGAVLGAILPAVETRLKAAVLSGAGFCEQRTYPEVSQIHFAPHVKIPTLMLSGRYNTFFPIELCVQPMYDLLGTPEPDKRLLLFDSGAYIPQRDLTRETVAWLDKYLGPVEWKAE